jgi:hypothetical protein
MVNIELLLRHCGGHVRIKTLLSSFCVLIAAVAIALPASASAAPGLGPVTPACSWRGPISVASTNENLLDSAATYWLLSFTVQDGLQIRLDGRYPDSRYASLQAYTSAGALFTVNGVTSALTDYQIQPDPGSVNPWQRSAGYHWPGRNAFTVTLQSDVVPGQANTLPLAPAGTTSGTPGYLEYRVYLPAGGGFSRIAPPVVTFTLDGVSQRVPPCPPGTASATSTVAGSAPASAPAPSSPAPSASDAATGPATDATTQTPEFARPQISGDLPNADSAYLIAEVTPPASGDVLVIQGQAPTASRGSHPSPWPAPFTDLRYWSLCNYVLSGVLPLVANPLPDGQTDYGCRYDSQVATDRHGSYTFVVGTEAQRPFIERIPGATFLPFSTADPTTPHVLFLRDMLANPGFAQAIQNVPPGGDPASAAAVMGPYYPRTAICPLSTLLRGGPGTCLAGLAG